MNVTRLPQELLDLSISYIHDDFEHVVVNTLFACSLAGRQLVQPSQRKLFSDIRLFPNTLEECKANLPTISSLLHRLLQRSPHLGSYVRTLTIEEGVVPLQEAGPSHHHHSQSRVVSWLASDPSIPTLLTCFPKLGLFELFNNDEDQSAGIIWAELTAELQQALLTFLRQPSLTRVKLSLIIGQTLPNELFNACQSLRDLQLGPIHKMHSLETARDIFEYTPVITNARKPRLRTLGIQACDLFPALVEWLVGERSPLDVGHLQGMALVLGFALENHEHAAPLLRANKETLTQLLFQPSIEVWGPDFTLKEDPISLAGFTALRAIKILAIMSEHVHKPGPWLAHFFSTLGTSPVLEDVGIFAIVGLDEEEEDLDEERATEVKCLDRLGWEMLDEVLSADPERFPALRTVQMRLEVLDGLDFANVEAVTRKEMKRLEERGILTVSVMDGDAFEDIWEDLD